VTESTSRLPPFHADVCARALDARDPRFDGLFFVGITTTWIYCRPICPARVSYPDRRRFFASAAAAERAGFRPCLRCRPELAPGRAIVDAVPRLASAATNRIGAGALNGHSVAELAGELGVSARHLRRALEREVGVSPIELAQTYRLLLAKRLLADTRLSVTRIAFASGFQSLRRFNAAFHEQYRMAPSALRRAARPSIADSAPLGEEPLRLTLAYRAPFAWEPLLELLARDAVPGVEVADGRRYGRTVRINGRQGIVFAQDAPENSHLILDVSPSLVPVLMPLLARLRQLFDLDAEPLVIDAHLSQGGLGDLVRARPGMRIPGALDGFEIALRGLLGGGRRSGAATADLVGRVTEDLGEPLDTGVPSLTRLAPDADRLAEAGSARLVALGASRRRAEAAVALARAVAGGTLRLEPGGDARATRHALLAIDGIGDSLATGMLMRALRWPDAFPLADRRLQRAAGVSNRRALLARAERWRPWRAYAALHLWLREGARSGVTA
jgi:AraC family transcriptional regulator of adaptative response / DNA-3-methyladenine glycosylase II